MTLPTDTNTRRRLALLFSIPLAFSLIFFFVNLAAEQTDIRLIKIQNLSSSIVQLRSLARDAESSERGFLLTGDDRYLLPLKQANVSLQSQIEACLEYARDLPALRGQVETLAAVVKKRFAEANEILTVQTTKGFAAAIDYTRAGESEQTMNAILRTVDDLQSKLNREEKGYLDSEATLNERGFIFFLLGTVVMVVVLAWLYNVLLSHLQQRDEAQRQLQMLNAELEARVEARTRDLTEANEELGQFAYVASHDLQEPLRTITTFTQLLESRYKGRLDEDADEFIGYIVTSSRRMSDLINGLLALVRLRKAGQQTMPVSFEKLLEEAEISLQGAIRDNEARIQHGLLPSLVVDKVQFSQVLQNLISNAIKYRRQEPPFIRVDAKRDTSNWIFSVADNGRGFNQQFAERIFGLFQRLHGREVEGTGMGLSITRKIVERHGGRIWAESSEGTGSTFYFSLPVSLEVPRQAAADRATPAVAQA